MRAYLQRLLASALRRVNDLLRWLSTAWRGSSYLQRLWSAAGKNVQELLGIPVALLLFYVSGRVLQFLDPASGTYDSGLLQGVTLVIVHLLVANSLARFGVPVNMAWLYRNQDADIVDREQWEKDRKWLFERYLLAYCLLAAFL